MGKKSFVRIDVKDIRTDPPNVFRNLEVKLDKFIPEDIFAIEQFYLKALRKSIRDRKLMWRGNLRASVRVRRISNTESQIVISEGGFMLSEMQAHAVSLITANAPIEEWVADHEPLQPVDMGEGPAKDWIGFKPGVIWVQPHRFIPASLVEAFGNTRSYLSKNAKTRKLLTKGGI